ncbi:RCS-specific HTH-type transcriptional activator RclR [Ruegeria sp. THAF57]|uniref:helix-turn-helix domain-containing protein n=1 Tax=Ruegeria sp. THAF57 TaxID=2744555 RepID=UPI0015DE6C00|nr:AraC family transcriptional regulator [Ruegeria sp. THAF57]CAD0186841.1 RCS-specific HTH-type transcriptional activator RclR [Ruegeria sp. THAF57]
MKYDFVFDQLDISAEPFAVCEIKGDCEVSLGQDVGATLHYILSGEGTLSLRSGPPIPIVPGTLVLVPSLQSHSLRSFGTSSRPLPQCNPAELKLRHILAFSDNSSDGGQVTAICARVKVGLRGAMDVIDLVRTPIVEVIGEGSVLSSAIDVLLSELSNPALGSKAMIRAVLIQCMIEMLRRRLKSEDGDLRWMAALRDPMVWDALRVMLDTPGDPHTVESLAARVGMSRSAFAQRFTAAYGSGPIELLRDLRLRHAANLLTTTDLPVKRIAHQVGFNSRTAFSRVFEQRTGESPNQFRKSHRAG